MYKRPTMMRKVAAVSMSVLLTFSTAPTQGWAAMAQSLTGARQERGVTAAVEGSAYENAAGSQEPQAATAAAQDQAATAAAPASTETDPAKTAGSGDKNSAATDDGAKARDPRDITAEKNLVKVVFDGLKPGKVADAKEGEPALTAAGVMRFHVNLTPADGDAAIAGDTVKVKLPTELAAFGPLSDSQVIPALETTSRNDDGTPVTGAAVGEWKLDGDILTLKLGDLAKASKDAQSSKLTVDVAVPMTLKKDALGAEPADAKWTMLTQDGKEIEATLTLPAESEVADFATKPAGDAAEKNDAADDTSDAQDQPEQKADGKSASDSPEAPDFNLLVGEKPVLLSNKLPLVNLLSDEPTTTVTYKLSENSATASYKLFFNDSASANRPSAAEIETGLTLHFSVDGVTYDFTWENARDQLHMTKAEYDAVKIQANDEISNEYSFAAANLPKKLSTTTSTTTTKLVDKKDEEGNVILDPEGNPVQEEVPDIQVEESSVQIDWSMSFDSSHLTNTGDKGDSDYSGDWSNNYILADTVGDDGKTYDVLALTHVYHLKVDIEAAGYKYTDAELVEMLKQTYAAKTNVTLGPVGGTPVFEGTLLDFLNSVDTVGHDHPSAIKWTVVDDELVIYNMISYDLETGRPLDFVLRYDEQAPEGVGDYIKAVYDNSSAANHGGDSDAAYEGGTLRLLRAGNITFEATKTWVDTPEDAERTTETYALYRYRKGQGFSTASPVKVGNSYATVTVDPPAEGDSTTIAFLDGEGKPILLPKYDPEGYEYCYGVRTKGTDDGYQTIYGSLDAEGNPSSDVNVTPNHDKADRDGHDALVYNGATVTERRSGTTNVDATKTWRAAAFQNQLSDVTCTFELQSSPDGTTWSAAKDADGNAITRDLSGFSEEQMSKKFSDGEKNVSFPEFDKLGRPLEYRWVEKAVKQGDKVTELPANAEHNEFSLALKDPATGADTTVEFVSTVDPQTGDITNAYVNHTTLQIRKYWYDGTKDGQASYTQSPTAGENGWSATEKFVASFTVYRDGKKVCVVTTNGTPGTVTDLSDKLGDGASVEETSPYTLTLRNVPAYSDQGRRHSYLILENAASAVDRRILTDEVEIDGQKKAVAVTEFRNNPTGGEWSEVNVSKRWVTGGDGHGNASVKIELVAKHDLVYKSEDNGHHVGDVYKQEGDVVATVDLSAKKEWFDSVGLPVGGVTLADLSAREVSVTINGTTYDVVSGRDDILAAFRRYDPTVTENDLTAFPDAQAVIVDDHVFSVSNARVNGTLNSIEVSNTRVGWTSVEATKTWVDEGADKNQRPDARLELKVVEGSATIGTDADGNMTVTCGDTTYPVMAEVNGELVRCTAEALKIGKADDTQSFSIRYLPKYDQHGNNITYSLTEVMPDKGDYQCTAVWKGREVSAHHYYSDDTYDFTNQRSAQASIQFFKKWRDAHVYEQGLRPDIYMTLYKRDSDGFGKVDGYIDCQWSLETNDDNKGVITTNNGDYYQGATITNLPKYDSRGALIQYFASERMSVDGSKLDYAPVYYSGSEVNANPEVVSTIDGSTLTGEDATGANTAVAAGGTLDNDIASTQAVKGEKAWPSVPTGFLSKDLPDVQIKIRRNNPSAPTGTEDTLVAVVTISAKDYSGNSWTYQVGAMTNEAGEYVDAQGAVVDSADKAAKLPMYDEYGRKYTYHVQESLIEYQDGAPVTSDKNYDPTVDEAAAAAGKVEGIVFTRTWDPSGKGFRIENSYNGSPVSAIDVTKVYDGRADNDSYPAKLTFKLYRTYYSHDRGTYVTPQLVATQTMTAGEFKAAGTTGTTSLTKTFQGLATYSPDGFLWEYYVTESGTEAYTQSGKILNTGDAAANGVPAYVPDAGAYVGQGTGAVIGVITLNTADGKNGAVEFDNDYTTNDLTLTGVKVWDDNNDAAGMRSQFQTDGFVTLKRVNASGNMTEDVTLQSTDATKPNYIAWDTTTDAGKWTYTISNLEYWSPDSTPWKYTITEKNIDASTGYKAVTKTATCTNETKTDDVANVYEGSFTDLKNVLDGSASVSKEWDDGDTSLGLRPKTISVQLQARFAGEAWTSADDFFAANNWNMTVGANKDLTGKMTNTWGKLPTKGIPAGKDKVATNLQTIEYRVVETNIAATPDHGAVTVNVPAAQTDGASYTDVAADCYTVAGTTATKGNATSTAITNTRDVVSLTVSKTWADFDNEWGTRPEGGVVIVTIQRKVAGGDWVAVKGTDGKDLKVTLTADKPVTVGDLPRTDDNNNEISYRAIEDLDGMRYYVDAYDSYVEAEPPIELSSTDGADQDVPAKTYVSANEFAGESSDTPGAEIYEEINNSLKFVNVTVPKQFLANNNASTYDPTASGASPTMHVWRKVADGTWEKVYKADGKTEPTLTWTAVSGQAGRYDVSIENLPATNGQGQTYTYQIGEDPAWAKAHGFVVTQASEQGNVTKTNEPTTGTIVWRATDPIVNSQTELRIDKFFSADMYSDMSKVTGGTYKIDGTFSDGAKTKSVAVGGDHTAKLASGLLIPGNTYTLTETAAPDGYKKLSGSIKFKVADDGSITQVSSNIGSGKAELANEEFGGNDPKQKTGVVKVTDDPVKVQLTKVLEGSDGKGSDVQFALTPASANGYYLTDAGEKATAAKTVTTDSDGNVIMSGLVVGQKYTLTETVSNHPNAMLGAFTFTVNADGTVNAAAANANWAVTSASGVATLTATDPYIGLKIQKLDQNGNAISTDCRANGNDPFGMGTWTITPAAGSAFSDGMTAAKTLSYHDGIAYLKHGCTYTVVEATAPWGFAANGETLTVTVSDTGVISIASDKDTSEYAIVTASRKTGDATVATVSLKDKPLTVTLHKTNEDGTIDLQGATWALWGYSLYNPPTGGSVSVWGGHSNSNGDFTLGGVLLPDVTYGVSEPEPPAGYEWEDERNTISFVLNPDGTVKSYDAGNTSTFAPMTVGGPAVLVQRDKLIKVTLVKKDENGNPIKGSTFTISGRFAAKSLNGSLAPTDETRTFADTADGSTGSIAIDRLVAGQKYVITETVPPAGYVNANGTESAKRFSAIIEVQKDGTVKFVDTPNGDWSLETTVDATTSDCIALKDVKTRVSFAKWGVEADADPNGQKSNIDGATFTVTPAAGSSFSDRVASKTFTTGTDTTMEGLVVGNTYKVVETTAPAGYARRTSEYTVKVNQDGTLTGANGDAWKIAADGKGVVLSDALTNYALKKASNDADQNPDAQFVLTGKVRLADSSITDADHETTLDTTASTVAMTGLIEGEHYTVAEAKAPDYHVPDTTPFTFHVENGKLVADATSDVWQIAGDGASLTMTDAVIRPTIHKQANLNGTSLPTPGAEFEAFLVDGDNVTSVGTFKTDANGNAKLPALLVSSTYRIDETKAPNGCLAAKSATLTVDDQGTVTMDGTVDGWTLSQDRAAITLTDQVITAKIHKTGDTAQGTAVALSGATFELTGDFINDQFAVAHATRSFTTDANGDVALTHLVAGKTYTVHEAVAPKGYVAGPDFTIAVDKNGELAVATANAAATVENNVVTVNDVRTNPLIGKSDFEHAVWNADYDKVIGAGSTIDGGISTFSFKPTGVSTFADGSTAAKTAEVDASKDVSLASSLANATQLKDLGFVVGYTYEVEELTAPAGYSVATDKPVVRVKADGRFEFVDPDDVGFRWLIDAKGVLVSLDAKIQISFEKADTDGNRIYYYCEYQVRPADGSAFADGTTAARTIRVNYKEPGNAAYFVDSISGVVAGNTYIIKESKAPAGYAASDVEYSFRVDPDGKFTQVAEADGWTIGDAYGTGRGTLIRAMDKPNNLTLVKRSAEAMDDQGQFYVRTLKGAEFTLVDEGDENGQNKATDRTITSDKGRVQTKNLPGGHTYTITETKAAPGFAVAPGHLTFKVKADGTFSLVENTAPGYWGFDSVNATITCWDVFNRVKVRKVTPVLDTSGKPVTDAQGNPTYQGLAGVSLKLDGEFTDRDGVVTSTSQTQVTDADGYVTFSGVVAGKDHVLSELDAPAGYELTGERATVAWASDGTCTTKGQYANVAVAGGVLAVTDDPTRVEVKKTDAKTGAAVAGVEFTVTPRGDATFRDGSTAPKIIKTGADGQAILLNEVLLGKSYTIQETASAPGYKRSTSSATFTVKNDGTPEFGAAALPTGWSFASGVLGVTNQPVAVTIAKADGATALAGATFELAPTVGSTFADGTADAIRLTTDEHGNVVADGKMVIGNTYILTEVEAPTGYTLPTGDAAKRTLTVDNDGKVQLTTGGTLSATMGSGILTVSDAKLSFTITKKSTEGDTVLPGATFKVTGAFVDGSTEKTFTTDKNGLFKVDGIKKDETYTVTEQAAPAGFAKATGSFTFALDANGNATIGDYTGADYGVDPVVSEQTSATAGTVGCTFLDKPLKVAVSKSLVGLDADAPAIQNATAYDGMTAAGATFTLEGRFFSSESGRVDAATTRTHTVTADEAQAGAFVMSGLVAGEQYVLTETHAPDGFEVAAPFTFTMGVGADNAIDATSTDDVTVGSNATATDYPAGAVAQLTVKDNPLVMTLVKNQLGDNGATSALNGAAEYSVAGPMMVGGTRVEAATQTVTGTADSNQVRLAGLIEGATYVVTETHAPDGYATVGIPVTCKVEGGKLVPAAGTVDQWSADGMSVSLTDRRTSVSFEKVDARGTAVPGCTMTLTDKNNNQVDQWVTGNDAHVITGTLVEGEQYTLTETTPAAGFATADPVTFTVAALNGQTQAVSMTDAQTSVSITKVDEAGTPLANCQMQVTHKDGDQTVVDSAWTTDGTAHVMTGVLVEGREYTLTEAVPAPGYTKAADQTFTVAAGNGAVQSVSLSNAKTSFSLTKTNADGTQNLSGATYVLTGAVPDAISATLLSAPDAKTTIETGDAGTVTLTGLLVAGQSYTLEETVAPLGHKRTSTPLQLTVATDGTVSIAGGNDAGAWTLGENNALVNRDEQTSLKLRKLSDDGTTSLSGNTFAIAPRDGSAFADGTTEPKSFTTGDDGTVDVTGVLVQGGAYVVSETVVPAGYTIGVTQNIVVDVTDGSVRFDGANDGHWANGSEGMSLTNEKTTLSLLKTNADGTPLPGATFRIVPADGSAFAMPVENNALVVTTDAAGKASIANGTLVIGNTYRVSETVAPKGYLPNAEAAFTVAADGSLSYVGNPAGWTIAGTCLQATDSPVAVGIQKVENDTQLRGYSFRIDGPIYADGIKVADSKTFDVEDSATVLSGCLATGVQYTLTETKAPANHRVTAAPCTFSVDATGQVTIDAAHSDPAFTVLLGRGIQIDDEAVTMSVTKVDVTDQATSLARAEYTIAPADGSVFADGSTAARALVSGADGTVTFEGLATGGTYTVTETRAPEGYVEGDPIVVKVDATTGLISQVGAAAGWTVSADGRGRLVNTDAKTSFSLTKTNADGTQNLSGATFELRGVVPSADSATGVTDENHVTTLELGDDGTLSLDGLLVARQHYALTETVAPLGYARHTQPLGFTVDAKGAITFDQGDTAYTLADGNAIALADDQISLTVTKVDGTSSAALAGAEYAIRPKTDRDRLADGNAAVAATQSVSATTGEDGTATFVGCLVAGHDYTIEETRAPEGYARDTRVYDVHVNEGGEVVVSPGAAQSEPDAYVPASSVTMTDVKTAITLTKVTTAEGNDPLAGGLFTIKTGDRYVQPDGGLSDEPHEFETDADGKIDLTGLLSVKTPYVLTETRAPKGYELVESTFAFQLDDAGTLVPADRDAEHWIAPAGSESVTVADTPVELSVAKTDKNGEALTGATFQITPAVGSAFADGAESHELTVTDEDPTLASISAQLIAGNTYVISEATAPYGYELCSDATFTVGADGRLTLDDESGDWTLGENGDQLTASDVTIDMTLTKLSDLTDKPLEGAVFELSGNLVADDGSVCESTLELDPTNKDGVVDLSGRLVAGETYTLTETHAPAGYKLAVPMTFSVDEAGNARMVGTAAGWSASETGAEFSVKDDPLSLTFSKVSDQGSKPLSGARFSVEGRLASGATQMTFVTDEKGLHDLTASLVLGEKYVLTELEAPNGYTKVGKVTLRVNEDGTFSLSGDYDAKAWSLSADGKTIKAVDALIPTTGKKSWPLALTGDATPAMGLLALVGAAIALLATRLRKRSE